MDIEHIITLFEETQHTTPIRNDETVFVTVDPTIPDDEARQIIEETLFEDTKYTTDLTPPEDKKTIHIATVPNSTKQTIDYIDESHFTVLIDDVF